MKKSVCFLPVLMMIFLPVSFLRAQQPASSSSAVPRMLNFSGRAADAHGTVLTGVAGITFSIYGQQYGGAPLWIETQNVTADAKGNYTAQLGATQAQGLPLVLFNTGEARWLGVRVNGGEEQSRVMLLSVPYALKAADAETIGGLPPSAFMLAAPAGTATIVTNENASSSSAATPSTSSNVTTTGGTINALPLWTTATNIQNSAVTQTLSGTTPKISIKGILAMPASGGATATAGKSSEPIYMTSSAFNSGSGTAVGQTFALKNEPANNNTASTGATLNLLFAQGTAAPAETGFKIAKTGIVTFAAGQLFPGTGTITGMTAGTGLTGGGVAGAVTLNIDTTEVPQLNTANTFTGNQTTNGNVTATGVVTGNSFQIGSNLFDSGNYALENAFLGFAGNTTMTGGYNTAAGYSSFIDNTVGVKNTGMGTYALFQNTTGVANTAFGYSALWFSSTGSQNTAIGAFALNADDMGSANTAIGDSALDRNTEGNYNTATGLAAGRSSRTGSNNTFLGYFADVSTDPVNNAGAIGSNAMVGESNAMVLGGTGANAVSVGIGTPTPYNDYAMTLDTTNSNGTISGGVVVNASGGNLYLGMTNGTHKFRVDTNGAVFSDSGFSVGGADFAESVAVRGSRAQYEPGDVLEIDPTADRHLTLSHHRYATLVAGIYSTKPGMLASPHSIDEPIIKTGEVPLAVVGIVPCKVTTENGSIARGDLLVTSSRPGYAMKGTDRRRLVGAVVGKALEPLAKGSGVIQVLVTLQ